MLCITPLFLLGPHRNGSPQRPIDEDNLYRDFAYFFQEFRLCSSRDIISEKAYYFRFIF